MVSSFVILDFMPVDDRGIAAVMVHGNGILIILKNEAAFAIEIGDPAARICFTAPCINDLPIFFVVPNGSIGKPEIGFSLEGKAAFRFSF